jgi:hypothetical protein
MRCRCCDDHAGFLRRLCGDCARLLAIFERHRTEVSFGQLLDLFIATGVGRAKIEAVLESDLEGKGLLRDRVTADMANRLLAAMGMTPKETARDVRRVREQGAVGASTTRPASDVGPPPRRR